MSNLNNTKAVSNVNQNASVVFLHYWACKSTRFETAPAVPAVDFTQRDFLRWAGFAVEAAYTHRTGRTDCPYVQAKSALRRLGGATIREAFNDALRKETKNSEVLKHLVKGTAPTALEAAVAAATAQWEMVDLAYAKFSALLFNGYALGVPSMDVQLLPAFGSAEAPRVPVQEVSSVEDIDVQHVLSPLAWRIYREDGAKRVIKAMGLPCSTTPMSAWFKMLTRLAVLSAAFGGEKTDIIEVGGVNREIHTRGWKTSRMIWLRNAVHAPDAYAGDPRDYAGQLAVMEEELDLLATLESVYDEYKDVMDILCAQLTPRQGEERMNPRRFTIYTDGGLWADKFVTEDGVQLSRASAETLEDAIDLVSLARVHSVAAYAVNRENENEARKKRAIAQFGW